MIRASFYQNAAGSLIGYEISGHAGYAEEGYDIVCAAVSVLAVNTANALEMAGIKASSQMEDGYIHVQLPEELIEEERHDACLLLNTLKLGLESIRESYGPKYLKLSTY